MEAGKRVGVIVGVGIAASIAGVAAVASVLYWRDRHHRELMLATRLRDVQEVLKDCDVKLKLIEQHLPQLVPAVSNSTQTSP